MHKLLARFLPQGGLALAATAFGSYALGLLRDRVFAHQFGAGAELDAYNAAFLVPDFLLNFFVAGGLSAAFVPIFSEALRIDRKRAELFAQTVFTGAILVMAFWGLLLFLVAPLAAPLVAPGFDAQNTSLLITLLQVLSFSPILFAASNALGGVLIARKSFLSYGLSPMLYNLGIIGGTIFLSPLFGIFGAALGTLIGALLHGAIRAAALLRTGFPLVPKFAFSLREFRGFLRLMVPKMFGHPIELATFWGFTAIASTLGSGSVVVLNFARNFQSVPVSLIGISFATASFPLLAECAAGGKRAQFSRELGKTFRLIAFTTVPAAALMFLLREPLIGILLGGGAFGKEAVAQTAATLGIFTLSIPTESVSHLLARAFYATKNTAIPVAVSVLGFLFTVASGVLFAPEIGVQALPLAFFIGSLAKTLILWRLLPLRLNTIEDRPQ